MKLTYKELRQVIGQKMIDKLFKGGAPSAWVTYKIDGLIIEYSPLVNGFFVGWYKGDYHVCNTI